MKKVDLNGTWQFRSVDTYRTLPASQKSVKRWMNASVPGTVHTDLLSNKKIPDPYYRMNENAVQWIDGQQWIYRRQFAVTPDLMEEQRIDLVADGLDTYATISINGRPVGTTANMFVEHRFDVKRYIRSGTNTIEILFDSPTVRSRKLEEQFGRLQVALEPHRVYVRKAQYSFSWDWGPKLTTSGIWRPIYLEAWSVARICDVSVKVEWIKPREAAIAIKVDLERSVRRQLALHVSIVGERSSVERSVAFRGGSAELRMKIPDPELWWPNGYGDQPLYTAMLSLREGERELHRERRTFGLRTVRLIQERDREGRSFIFEINGKKIFCKGADWIPGDNFIPRIRDEAYQRLLGMAKDAHMNMVRVWGGGIYEQEIFYELCDRLGLMVWQDFMYACGEYPGQRWFLKQAKEEAEKAVRRLRNHPCIILWCGNNECEWLFCVENPGKKPDEMKGAKIFRDILPSVCEKLDGTRPYWRSSPFGESFPNDESNGNHHQWGIWSAWKDYPEYDKVMARFVTEFGFQAPANVKTFEEVTLPSDRHPQSAVMEHHNKQGEGTERLFRFQAGHYKLGTTLEDFIYKGQLVQAEALKRAIEHWRRRKFKTAGSLFWQLHDCWPVSSWAVIDSALRPKAAYFYAKRFFAPVLITVKRSDGIVECWGINDTFEAIHGKLEVVLRSFDGKKLWSKSKTVKLPKNSSICLKGFEEEVLPVTDPSKQYLHIQLLKGSSPLSENRYFFVEPKHLKLPRARVKTDVHQIDGHRFSVVVRTNAFAKNVWLSVKGRDIVVSDNYFDLEAESPKIVLFESRASIAEFKKGLRAHALR